MSYKIVEGFPGNVEIEVQELMNQGWQLNGPLFPRIHDGHHLVVQSLVHNDPTVLIADVIIDDEVDNVNVVISPTLSDLVARVIRESDEQTNN